MDQIVYGRESRDCAALQQEENIEMNFTIRDSRAGDAEQLHHIMTSPHVVRGTMRLPNMPLETTVKRLAPEPNRLQIVADSEDIISGFAELLTNFDTPRAAHMAELNMVVVRQEDRRKGVARALVERLIELCDGHLGIHRISLTVWIDNQKAIDLYESLGFEKEGQMRDYVRSGNGFTDAIAMARVRVSLRASW